MRYDTNPWLGMYIGSVSSLVVNACAYFFVAAKLLEKAIMIFRIKFRFILVSSYTPVVLGGAARGARARRRRRRRVWRLFFDFVFVFGVSQRCTGSQ